MNAETTGTVLTVKTQWWLKVNTKSFRKGPLDGATFPHVIKVAYTVDGVEYTRRKWIHAGAPCPAVGEKCHVVYQTENPKKSRVIFP